MWYEIIPSFAIITLAISTPYFLAGHIHDFAMGNRFRRHLYTNIQRYYYLRDNRLTGDVYKPAGLENIPDE